MAFPPSRETNKVFVLSDDKPIFVRNIKGQLKLILTNEGFRSLTMKVLELSKKILYSRKKKGVLCLL